MQVVQPGQETDLAVALRLKSEKTLGSTGKEVEAETQSELGDRAEPACQSLMHYYGERRQNPDSPLSPATQRSQLLTSELQREISRSAAEGALAEEPAKAEEEGRHMAHQPDEDVATRRRSLAGSIATPE